MWGVNDCPKCTKHIERLNISSFWLGLKLATVLLLMESETTLSSNMTADNIDSALVLCQCIEDWQESSNINDVKKFDWVKISANMNERGCPMSTTECCKVWKYVAYGRLFRDDEVLEIVSDEEDAYHQPLSALKRFKKESPSKPWLAANPEAEVSLLNLCRPGPNLSSVRMQFKKVKVFIAMCSHKDCPLLIVLCTVSGSRADSCRFFYFTPTSLQFRKSIQPHPVSAPCHAYTHNKCHSLYLFVLSTSMSPCILANNSPFPRRC